ncbi:MAG: YcaQ family DNA glycosylase [Clostridia bacterium]|nr:YcaQ family DNA glycosylase [Clostridia bacterium]
MDKIYTVNEARKYLARLHFSGNKNVYEVVRKLQAVQYDPLNVVGRNPDLVLQSRIKKYKPEMLQKELYKKRTLVDGFDKMLCIYPAEDYPYLARLRRTTVWWYRENPEITNAFDEVRKIIREKGPVSSDDIGMEQKVAWPWGATRLSRAALESMWMTGELTIHHKDGARRYYDLAEKYLPESLLTQPDPNGTEEAYYEWQTLRRIRAVGMLRQGPSDAFLGVENYKAEERRCAFGSLSQKGKILKINVEGDDYYIPAENLPLMDSSAPVSPLARAIAPLDNLMWDRKLIKRIFDFDYTWEVYTPKEKRKYGYYVLPVFYKDRFIARFEPEPYRGGRLKIKTWWWEENVRITEPMKKAVLKMLEDFAGYLGAEEFESDTAHLQ